MVEATAYHEAGHAVARWWLNLRFKEASIIPDSAEGTLGHVEGTKWPKWFNPEINRDSPYVRRYAENVIISRFAGQIAEQKYRGRRPKRDTHHHDDQCAVKLAIYFREGETLEAFLKYLFLCSRNLVEGRWPEIGRVAAALLRNQRLTYEDVIVATTPPAKLPKE